MRRKRRHKKKQKIIIMALLSITLLLSVGYAAFSTTLTLTAKGNIAKTKEECFTVIDNGDGTGTITDYDVNCGTKVTIPESINNLTITKIGDATYISNDGKYNIYDKSFSRKGITKVTFPDTITEIGYAAFAVNDIKELTLPKSLVIIGQSSFAANLIEGDLYIPEKVEIIKNSAFANYSWDIENVRKIDDRMKIKGLYFTENSDLTTIEAGAFTGNKINSLIFPNKLQTLEAAFMYNELVSVGFGNNIQTINNSTFNYNDNLKTININRKENAISGSPWGATNATVNWTGTN